MSMSPLNMNLPEDFRQLSPMQKVVYCTGALAGLVFMAPLTLLALQSVTTITLACIVSLGLFMGFSALPSILRWWRIRVLNWMKVIARRNPVETLQLELIDRRKAFAAASTSVVAISAMRQSRTTRRTRAAKISTQPAAISQARRRPARTAPVMAASNAAALDADGIAESE